MLGQTPCAHPRPTLIQPTIPDSRSFVHTHTHAHPRARHAGRVLAWMPLLLTQYLVIIAWRLMLATGRVTPGAQEVIVHMNECSDTLTTVSVRRSRHSVQFACDSIAHQVVLRCLTGHVFTGARLTTAHRVELARTTTIAGSGAPLSCFLASFRRFCDAPSCS